MKKRNMVYANNQAGGFFNPNMGNPMPSGFTNNSNYMAYGPNVVPGAYPMTEQSMMYDYEEESLENRLSKIERQIRKLDTRVTKLESVSDTIIDDATNMYMI